MDGEDAERNREQKPIAVELMTSGMANERKDEMIVMKVLMNRGFMTKEEQPDALNATSRAWEDEMTGRHTRSRRGIKQVIAQDVERVTEKPLGKD